MSNKRIYLKNKKVLARPKDKGSKDQETNTGH